MNSALTNCFSFLQSYKSLEGGWGVGLGIKHQLFDRDRKNTIKVYAKYTKCLNGIASVFTLLYINQK